MAPESDSTSFYYNPLLSLVNTEEVKENCPHNSTTVGGEDMQVELLFMFQNSRGPGLQGRD